MCLILYCLLVLHSTAFAHVPMNMYLPPLYLYACTRHPPGQQQLTHVPRLLGPCTAQALSYSLPAKHISVSLGHSMFSKTPVQRSVNQLVYCCLLVHVRSTGV
jgi:hypothetical protein